MFNKFFKKNKKTEKEIIKETKKEDLKKEEKKIVLPEQEETIEIKIPQKKEDFDTVQSKLMGLDMKDEVKRYSRAFFNSKNEMKKDCYLKFETFLDTLAFEKKREIQTMTYMEFKEKEEQVTTTLRNGFSQFLSKGAILDEKTRSIINIVFGDVKKLASRGHRYWYFKIYIWQKREED